MAEVLARKNDPACPPVMLGNAMTQLKEGRAVNCDGEFTLNILALIVAFSHWIAGRSN